MFSNFTRFQSVFVLPLMIMGLVACGSSSSTTSATSSANGGSDSSAAMAFPTSLAVTSPLAGTSSASSSVSAQLRLSTSSSTQVATLQSGSDFSDKVDAIETVLAAATDEACQVVLNLAEATSQASCYGPELDFEAHPDAVDVADEDGELPGGDLGIWESEDDEGQACTAAKIATVIEDTELAVDRGLLLAASTICLMDRDGTSLPSTDGDSVDMTSSLNTALQANNSTVTVNSATVSNETDVTDNDASSTTRDVYEFDFELDVDGTTLTTTLRHMPTNSDNSTFKGRITSQSVPTSGSAKALTMSYEVSSSSELAFEVISASFSDLTADYFDVNDDLDLTEEWEDAVHTIMNIDPTNGEGDFSVAWQAGDDDSHARIFNGYADDESGCGFFGFGDNFNPSTGAASDNEIDGFICNWAGPESNHSVTGATADLAQKQCMDFNSSTGQFEVDSSYENITYAPTNSCDSAGVLGVKLSDDTTYDTTAVTNDLVDLTTDAEFADYAAPEAPSIPADL